MHYSGDVVLFYSHFFVSDHHTANGTMLFDRKHNLGVARQLARFNFQTIFESTSALKQLYTLSMWLSTKVNFQRGLWLNIPNQRESSNLWVRVWYD